MSIKDSKTVANKESLFQAKWESEPRSEMVSRSNKARIKSVAMPDIFPKLAP